MCFQPWKEGWMFSKILLFLVIQIAQEPSMMISMKKGTFNFSFRSWKASSTDKFGDLCGHMKFQHILENWHSQYKWYRVSSCWQFITTQVYSSKIIDFLLNRFLVFSLSWISIQKNILCLGWHEDFQIQAKWGGTCLTPMITLYAFEAEKLLLPHI